MQTPGLTHDPFSAGRAILQDPRVRTAGFVALGIFVALILIDVVFLSGKPIHHGPVKWFVDGDMQEFSFEVADVGTSHLVEIDTEDHRVALSWSVLDPEGKEVFADKETLPHTESRSGSFVPRTAGRHVVRVHRDYSVHILRLLDLENFTARVVVGERRILRPLFQFLTF